MMKYSEVSIKNIQSWIIFSLIIVNLIAFIFLSNMVYLRLDLTHGQKYSISKPTIELLRKLDKNNTLIIEYYYNDKCNEHPVMAQVVQYIQDMLKEYENSARGLVNYTSSQLSYEKQKDMAKIDELEKMGIQSFPLSERQKAESKTSLGFSGIVLKYKDKQSVMPQVYQDVSFEYNLDSEIRKLVEENANTLGIIIAASSKTYENDYKYIKQYTEEQYKSVVQIQSGESIPNQVSTLLIIGGNTLTDYDILQIDQFLMNGGKAFIALNGVNVIINPQYGIFGMPNDTKLFNLLQSYGITVNKNLVGDNDSYNGLQQGFSVYRYPIWPKIKSQNVNKKHPCVDELNGFNLFWPSSIDIADKIKNNTTLLFSTTKAAWAMNKDFKLDINTYKYPIQQSEKVYNIAYAFTGNLDSYFKDKPIPKNEKGSSMLTGNIIPSGSTQLVVIGNETVFENKFLGEEEMMFLLNSLDWLSTDNSLIQIRNKGKFSMPLDKALNDDDKNFKQSLIIVITTYIIPLLFIALAVVINVYRYKKNQKIKEKYIGIKE